MRKRTLRARLVRATMALAVGGSAFQLSGCDPGVRDTLISGLEGTTQSLSTALISALFTSIRSDSSVSTGV